MAGADRVAPRPRTHANSERHRAWYTANTPNTPTYEQTWATATSPGSRVARVETPPPTLSTASSPVAAVVPEPREPGADYGFAPHANGAAYADVVCRGTPPGGERCTVPCRYLGSRLNVEVDQR